MLGARFLALQYVLLRPSCWLVVGAVWADLPEVIASRGPLSDTPEQSELACCVDPRDSALRLTGRFGV